ncbi:MAG TPA: hypothetical protein VH880_01905 [Anaeromyxobacteraceae bacterium]|jgi:hypothetical protein
MSSGLAPAPAPRRLLAALSLALALMAAAILALHGGSEAGIRMVIRATARTSFGLFLLSFAASALARIGRRRLLAWPFRNQRQLLLAFAVSHAIHLAAIGAFARLHPESFRAAVPGSAAGGAIAYAFIAAMAATSFDRSAAWLGPRAWRALHLTGAFYVWVSFLVAFARRASASPGYWLPVGLLAGAMALRLAGYVIGRRGRQGSPAGAT